MCLRVFLIATSAFPFLMGCGGGGGGAITVPAPNGPSFSELQQGYNGLDNQQGSLSAIDVDTGTFSGTAQFSGFVIYDEVVEAGGRAPFTLAGEVDLEVAFSSSRNVVTGEISNLADTSDIGFVGDIELTSGQIDPNNNTQDGYAMSAGLSGSLRDADRETYTAQGGIDADFFGAGADYVGGITFLTLDDGQDVTSLRGNIVAGSD